MTRNKEHMISEKHLTANYGVTLAVAHAPVIHSSEFADFDSFMAQVQKTWDETWQLTYSTSLKGLPPFVTTGLQTDPVLKDRLGFLFHTLLAGAAFLVVLYYMARVLLAGVRMLGPQAQGITIGFFAAWTAISYARAQVKGEIPARALAAERAALNGDASKKRQ